jgi:hypothetical protein
MIQQTMQTRIDERDAAEDERDALKAALREAIEVISDDISEEWRHTIVATARALLGEKETP